jgi:hypothetical protein
MPVATQPITGTDTPLDVILGLGVLLIFVGVVFRAVTARWPGRRRACAQPDAEQRESRPTPCTTVPPARQVVDLASRLHEPVAEAPEPELARLKPETLAPLARILDTSRRLDAAEARVAGELAALPEGFWLVERDVHLDGRRIPFLVIGATGVFLICASDGAWTLDDLHVMSQLADQVRQRLPGYDGEPHAAVCLAFDEIKPRAWFGGKQLRGQGGCVLGVDWLRPWIFGFGPKYGLREGDVRALDEACGPFWDRRSTARLPLTQNFG